MQSSTSTTQKSSNLTKKLTLSAILIAGAMVIALISDFLNLRLPFGGSFTLASCLPLVIISYLYGVRWGLFSSFIYSILQVLISSRTVFAMFTPGDDAYEGFGRALFICLCDYIIAYTIIGLSGLFRNMKTTRGALCVGAAVGLFLRYIVHIISGAVFFGAWAEWFFTDEMGGTIGSFFTGNFSGTALSGVYSIVYNGLYMLPEIVITVVCAALISRLIKDSFQFTKNL
jgi:thiamine transporter